MIGLVFSCLWVLGAVYLNCNFYESGSEHLKSMFWPALAMLSCLLGCLYMWISIVQKESKND